MSVRRQHLSHQSAVRSLATQHGALQIHLPGKMSQLLLLASLHSVLVPGAPSQMWQRGLLREKVGQRSFPSEGAPSPGGLEDLEHFRENFEIFPLKKGHFNKGD